MGPSYGPSISNSWDHRKLGGNYTVQAEVAWANIIIIRLEWKAGVGRAHGGEGDPEEKLLSTHFWPLHLSQCPHLAPNSSGQPYITLTQTRGRGAGQRGATIHQWETRHMMRMIPPSSKHINNGTTQTGRYSWCRADTGQLHQEVQCFL